LHFHVVFAALLGDPARLFEVSVAERLLAFPPIVAGIVESRHLLVDGFVDLDPPGLDVFFQEVVDRDDLV
jgi:hypothetical protein